MTREEYADQWAFENVPTWLAEPDVMQEVRRSTIREWLRGAFLAGCAFEAERCAEIAEQVCRDDADGYRGLQVKAREAGDTQGALAHLCEKDATLLAGREVAAAIRARQEGKNEG